MYKFLIETHSTLFPDGMTIKVKEDKIKIMYKGLNYLMV